RGGPHRRAPGGLGTRPRSGGGSRLAARRAGRAGPLPSHPAVLHRPARGDRLALTRELLPDAAIGTDLIAGFPGEDDDAFARTLAFVEASPITYGHVFPYSVRSGTTAAKLDGHQSPPTIAARARPLRAAGARKRAALPGA